MSMLAVFDLDFTVWDCGGTWCDHTDPPYVKTENGILDSRGRIIRLYENIVPILEKLKSENIRTASASRTGEPAWAEKLLKLFGIYDCFDYHEIYPGSKRRHFQYLASRSGVDFEDMIFFDDESRNIADIKTLGVRAVHVRDHNRNDMETIIEEWLSEMPGEN